MEVVAGSRAEFVEQVSAPRSLFQRYLSSLLLPDFRSSVDALTDADRWLRRHRRKRAPISHSNWRQYSNPDAFLGPADRQRKTRHLPVASGSRSKSFTTEAPGYPLHGWPDGGFPTCWGPSGWIRDSRSITYGVGSLEQYHECSASWTRSVEAAAPFMGVLPAVRFTVDGYVHAPYTIPGWQNSGYYQRLLTEYLPVTLNQSDQGSRYIRRSSWYTRSVAPTQAQLDYARRMALASMYGGTPGTRPNFVRALVELKDTRQTIRGLCHFFKWGRAVMDGGSFYSKVGNTFQRLSGSQVARLSIGEIAGAYLNYVFGIKPTWDDIKTFLDTLRRLGLEGLDPPQGRGTPGETVTSHYQVRPDSSRLAMSTPCFTGKRQWIFTGSYHQNSISVLFSSPQVTVSRSTLAKYPEVLETRVFGCVFARIRNDVSEFFKEHFGKVGAVWSYPAIETLWELLPWSWLVDWFAETRQKIRLAEREATTYWMRIGFEDPWVAERSQVFRHTYNVQGELQCITNLKARWYDYYAEQCFSQIESFVALSHGDIIPMGGSFERHPLNQGWPAQSFDDVPITVRTFQISVGMALVLSS